MFDLSKLSKLEEIRHGYFFKVYKVSDKETNKTYRAKISLEETLEEDYKIDISKKYELIHNLNYPTILKYIGYSPVNFENEKNEEKDEKTPPKDDTKKFYTNLKKKLGLNDGTNFISGFLNINNTEETCNILIETCNIFL